MASEIIDRQVELQSPPKFMSVVSATEEKQQVNPDGDPLGAISGQYVNNTVPAFQREESPPEQAQEDSPEESIQEAPETEESRTPSEEAASKMMERLGFKEPTQEEERTEEPEASNEEVVSDNETEPEEKSEDKPKKPRKKRAKKNFDTEDIKDIIRETASSVANAAQDSPRVEDKVEKPKADEIEVLNSADLEVFSEMESNPKYKGIRSKYKEYLVELNNYKRQWSSDNPGVRFDATDEEHSDFIDSSMPEFDDSDFDDARIQARAKKIVAESEQRYKSELESIKSQVTETQIKDELNAGTTESIAAVVKSVGDEYLKVVQEQGGDALKDTDPIAHDAINNVIGNSEKHLYELEKLSHKERRFGIDINNPVHKEIVDYALGKEQEIASLPSSQKNHNGKQFATTERWMSMSPQQREQHWRLEPSHIKSMYVNDLGQTVNNIIKTEKEKLDRYSKFVNGKKSSPKKKSQTQPSASNTNNKPSSPSLSGGTHNVSPSGETGDVNVDNQKSLKKFLWG
tara:strand:- start:3348 stop:4895 length:1548 start_codon:yes stop_codon:yes gene_type:complete